MQLVEDLRRAIDNKSEKSDIDILRQELAQKVHSSDLDVAIAKL